MIMFGSFLPSLWSSTNHSLLGSKEPTLLCNQVKCYFKSPVSRHTRHVRIASGLLVSQALSLWFAKTSVGTQNGPVVGRIALDMMITSVQREDSGWQEPGCAWSAHI
jgi:hypothetical protein